MPVQKVEYWSPWRTALNALLFFGALFSLVTVLYVFIPKDLELTWKLNLKRQNISYFPPQVVVCSPTNHTEALLMVRCYHYNAANRHEKDRYECRFLTTLADSHSNRIIDVDGFGPLECIRFNDNSQNTYGPYGSAQLHLHFPGHRRELIFYIHHKSTPMDSVQYDMAVPDSITTVGLQRKERRHYKGPVEIRYDTVKNVIPTFGDTEEGVQIIIRYQSAYVETWVEEMRQSSWWDLGYRFATLLLLMEKIVSFGQKFLASWHAKVQQRKKNKRNPYAWWGPLFNTPQVNATLNQTPTKPLNPSLYSLPRDLKGDSVSPVPLGLEGSLARGAKSSISPVVRRDNVGAARNGLGNKPHDE